MIHRDDLPATPDWFPPRYEGICPKCHEHKFIGHGPLCLDCFRSAGEHHIERGEN